MKKKTSKIYLKNIFKLNNKKWLLLNILNIIESLLKISFLFYVSFLFILIKKYEDTKLRVIIMSSGVLLFVLWVFIKIIYIKLFSKVYQIIKKDAQHYWTKKIFSDNTYDFSNNKTGQYISHYTDTIEEICNQKITNKLLIISHSIKILILSSFVLYFSWTIYTFVLFFVILNYLFSLIIKSNIYKIRQSNVKNQNVYSNKILSFLKKMDIFKFNNKNMYFRKKVKNINFDFFKSNNDINKKIQLIHIPFAISVIGFQTILFTIIFVFIKLDLIKYDYMVFLVFASTSLISLFSGFFVKIIDINSVNKFVDKIFSKKANENKKQIKKIHKISFHKFKLKFWPKNKSITLNLNRNKKYLIIGKNGVGKSSLLRAILNINKNYSGSIKLNNEDVNKICSKNIYKNIYFLDKGSVVSNESIIKNILWGEKEDFEKLKKIIKICSLHLSILDMKTEEISEGQKQKILLARALYKNNDILILDEALSNIDYSSKNKILDYLLGRKDLTLIRVAHERKVREGYDEIIKI